MRLRKALAPGILLGALLRASEAHADPVLQPMQPTLDLPTLTALGVVLPIAGDDNFNAKVALRYRVSGTQVYRDGLPLLRVRPEFVSGLAVTPQFSGSVFDLAPNTSYDIELHATDPDGNVDQTYTLTATTRDVPRDPPAPNVVMVHDVPSFQQALGAALPGDVITLANGTYAGQFQINKSGVAGNPIVIRGESQDGVILDGMGCAPCNILEIYGSFVHIERLSFAHAERPLRFQTNGAEGNVVRRVHSTDSTLGVGGKPDQKNFYICDNVFEGRLVWPTTYGDDMQAHASDDGLVVSGSGHVVCHNRVSGFADALQNQQGGTRANDFYGNDILWTYDDGIELDGMAGNGRCLRNRFMNTFDTLSYQPIFGGPAYTMRNVVINVENEEMKLHANGGNPPMEPSGVYSVHNTFVRPYHAIQVSTPNDVHNYVVENNLFITQAAPTDGATVRWDTPIDFLTGTIDYNGYFPEGSFEFGYGATGVTYPNFAAVKAGGRYEAHGVLLGASLFASGLMAPSDHHLLVQPIDAQLAAGAAAIDKGVVLANINDGFQGAAPDLGALEFGCPPPIYGPRPDGVDETTEPLGCSGAGGAGGASGGSGGAGVSSGPGGGTASGGAAAAGGASAGAAGSAAAGGTAGAATGAAGSGGAGGASGKGAGGVAGGSAKGGATGGGAAGKGGSAGGGPAGEGGGAAGIPSVAGGAGGGPGGSGGADAASADSGSNGGCGCRVGPSGAGGAAPLALAALLAGMARRARRRGARAGR